MLNFEDLITAIRGLAARSPELTLAQAAPELGALARKEGARTVQFLDSSGQPLRLNTRLQNAVAKADSVSINVPWNSSPASPEAGSGAAPTLQSAAPVVPGPVSEPAGLSAARERFIVEFDRLERANSFMAAKYVIDSLIPRVGIPSPDAKQFLRDLVAAGIVETTRVPSRRNPEFQATRVQLNRTHAAVERVLGNGKSPDFQPIRIPGGPLSEDIISNRR
jgi:hypothetical protein